MKSAQEATANQSVSDLLERAKKYSETEQGGLLLNALSRPFDGNDSNALPIKVVTFLAASYFFGAIPILVSEFISYKIGTRNPTEAGQIRTNNPADFYANVVSRPFDEIDFHSGSRSGDNLLVSALKTNTVARGIFAFVAGYFTGGVANVIAELYIANNEKHPHNNSPVHPFPCANSPMRGAEYGERHAKREESADDGRQRTNAGAESRFPSPSRESHGRSGGSSKTSPSSSEDSDWHKMG